MKVQYREEREWAWGAGSFGVIDHLADDHERTGVFYTRHLLKDGTIYQGGIFWTNSNDVDWTGEYVKI